MEINNDCKSVVILGKTGTGKSSILNSLTGVKDMFPEGEELNSKTKEVKSFKGSLKYDDTRNYYIIDTPGFYDSDNEDKSHIKNILIFLKTLKDFGGLNAVYFTVSLKEQKFDYSLQTCLSLLRTMLGEDIFKILKIIYTFKNDLSPSAYEKAKKRFKDLPMLLITSGFPVSMDIETLIYDYDQPDEFGMNIISQLKDSEKIYPEVLDHLENVDLDLTDPLKVFNALVNNSKSMKDLGNQLENLKEMTNMYKSQIDSFEKERKQFQAEMLVKEKKIEELVNLSKKETQENQKKINEMIVGFTNQINQLNDRQAKTINDMRILNEENSRRIQEQNENYRKEHEKNEKIRIENERILNERHQQNIDLLQKQNSRLEASNKELLDRPPTVIHHHHTKKRGCNIF